MKKAASLVAFFVLGRRVLIKVLNNQKYSSLKNRLTV